MKMNNSTDRFYLDADSDGDFVIKDRENKLVILRNFEDAVYMLNTLQEQNEMMRDYILINPKIDDKSFHHFGDRKTMRYGANPK